MYVCTYVCSTHAGPHRVDRHCSTLSCAGDIYICMHVFILLPQGKGYREMLADLEVDNAPALE